MLRVYCIIFLIFRLQDLYIEAQHLNPYDPYAEMGQCKAALGMEEGSIPDHAITASSSYESKSVGPQNARVRQEKNGGAWCPKAQISSEVKEFLEIDLQKKHLLTWTETQGRFGNGQGQEYTEAFLIEYWRPELGIWITYKDGRGEKVLTGNTNTYLVVRQRLELPFVASKVRFIPYSEHPRTVCMRVELYGCSWEQNLLSYSTQKGELRKPDINLEDISYDGIIENNEMRKGLGQLSDGLFGGDDFSKLLNGEQSGSRWVGWSNKARKEKHIEFIMEFDVVRTYTSVNLHSNNMFTRDVQVFSKAIVWFSLDGETYDPDRVITTIAPDHSRETARNVTILLRGKTARFLKILLFFSNKWILLSEITFESAPLDIGNRSNELEKYDLPVSNSSGNDSILESMNVKKEQPPSGQSGYNKNYIGLLTGVLIVVILLILSIVMFLVQRGKKKVHTQVALLHKHGTLILKGDKSTNSMHNNKLSSTSMLRDGLILSASKTCDGIGGNLTFYHEPYNVFNNGSDQKKNETVEDAAIMKGYSASLLRGKLSTPIHISPSFDVYSYPVLDGKQKPENFYAATNIIKEERREQHFIPGVFTSIKVPDTHPLETVSDLLDFPRSRLKNLEKIGQCKNGLIHLCEAEGVQDFNGTRGFQRKQLVIVKSLWRNSSAAKRLEFMKESSWLAALTDPNVAQVLGLCTQGEPLSALSEYSECGDLMTYMATNIGNESVEISHGTIVHLATQLASGMKYLESLDMVHRDVSARNCLIDKAYTLKISDHAMYCDRFDEDYYVSDTKSKLPIRWMSWEALLMGRHTSQSDVWAFAVTLWEMMMYCSQRPFADLTNEQVIENNNHWYQNDNIQRILPIPPQCPREIYDLMVECWKRNEADRPKFSEIHMFFQLKNSRCSRKDVN